MLLSFVNGMIVRIALMCSNVVIFPLIYLMECFAANEMSNAQLAQVYQQMGVIGAYAAHLDRQGQSKKPFLLGLLATLFVFYFMQTSCYFFWTQLLFPGPFAGHVNDSYFAYANCLEFFVFIFLRTRSSIKFCAKYLTIINVIFLFYINSYMYAAQFQFFVMLIVLSLVICALFLEYFEIPAIQDWNPFDTNTPRYASPRIGYQHVLADSNFGLGFDIWQSFIPLRPRTEFNLYE